MPNIAADDTALSLNPITSKSQPKRAFQREAADTRTKRVLMVGYGKTAQKLHQRIKQQHRFSHHIVAIHEPDETHAIDSDIERLRNTEQISDAIVRHAISEVWIAADDKLGLGTVHSKNMISFAHHPACYVSGTMLTDIDTGLPHQFKCKLVSRRTLQRAQTSRKNFVHGQQVTQESLCHRTATDIARK